MNEIAILYIATGEYINFFDDFYLSAEKYFLPESKKKYFLFTDIDNNKFVNVDNIEVIHVDKLPWPLNTLLRFAYFKMIFNQLIHYEYTFYFNANAKFVNYFDESELPKKEDNYLLGVIHPGYKNRPRFLYPFERNKDVSCHIGFLSGADYFQGCLNGGRTKEYIELIETCDNNVRLDLKRNLIAKVHDESYLNHFFLKRKPRSLSSNFSWPEIYGDNSDAVIIMKNKNLCDWYQNIK